MATRKTNKTIIPEIDIIKAGIDTSNKYDDLRNEHGYIQISRTKDGLHQKENFVSNLLAEEEEKLATLRDKLESIGIDSSKKKNGKKLSKKEKKKLKKKKPARKSYDETLLDAVTTDMRSHILGNGKSKKSKKSDKSKDKNKKVELHGLIRKSKKTTTSKTDKPVAKEEKSEVGENFKEIEKLTKDNIKDINDTIKIVDTQIKEMTSSSTRVRGRETAISNYIQAKSALINAKQSAIKDILNTRVKVYDIDMKKNKDKTSENNPVELLARVFPSIMTDKNLSSAISKDIASKGKNKDSKRKKKHGKEFNDGDALSRREKELVKSGDIEYNVYDSNIEYEGAYDVGIKKSWSTQEWIFVALDKHGNFMDIPKKLLPRKSTVNMVFDDQTSTAKDQNSGNLFKVFDLPTI